MDFGNLALWQFRTPCSGYTRCRALTHGAVEMAAVEGRGSEA